ncbi:MAG TPA: rhomboid-like protein [Streptosporangiaceae bacterium]|nr:rhomboid-like protein [Streptosporangiaceae bacterium]
MPRPAARDLVAPYAVAWAYLAGVTGCGVAYLLLPRADQAAVLRFASTNVHNLHTDPVGCLITSAFFPSGSVGAWPLLIALALFGACHVLGNWRTAAVCAAGHVIGTLVSEGIVGYRVSHGALPPADRYIIDVGPSYVVVAAIAVAVLYGGGLARAAALLDLAILTFAGDIFSGLGQLQVAAVGHATAIATGVIAGSLAVWQRRSCQRRSYQQRAGKTQIEQQGAGLPPAWPQAAGPAPPGAGSSQAGATAGRRAADQADPRDWSPPGARTAGVERPRTRPSQAAGQGYQPGQNQPRSMPE